MTRSRRKANESKKNARRVFRHGACLLPARTSLPAQAAASESLRAGKNFLATAVYSEAEDQRLLSLYKGLRVSDVTDGMDAVGLQNIGLMDPEIHPLWRDTEHFSHRFVGVAVTARYVPTQDPPAGKMTVAAYDEWAGNWYDKRSTEAYLDLVRKGTALVIEDAAERRCRLHRLLQHPGVAEPGLRRRRDQRHRPRYRRDHHQARPALLQGSRARHPSRAQRAGIGQPADRLRRRAGHARRHHRGRRRRRRGRAARPGRSRGGLRPEDHGRTTRRAAATCTRRPGSRKTIRSRNKKRSRHIQRIRICILAPRAYNQGTMKFAPSGGGTHEH